MLYTRKGDSGKTGLFAGRFARVSKNSSTTDTLGQFDELNSFLGLCKVKAREGGFRIGGDGVLLNDIIEELQQNLFCVQAEIAGAEKNIAKEKVAAMERLINEIERELPPITSFSVSGGTELSALLDIARALARRAERAAVSLHESGELEINEHTRSYLNRLSSMLFALARLANHKSGITEKEPHYK